MWFCCDLKMILHSRTQWLYKNFDNSINSFCLDVTGDFFGSQVIWSIQWIPGDKVEIWKTWIKFCMNVSLFWLETDLFSHLALAIVVLCFRHPEQVVYRWPDEVRWSVLFPGVVHFVFDGIQYPAGSQIAHLEEKIMLVNHLIFSQGLSARIAGSVFPNTYHLLRAWWASSLKNADSEETVHCCYEKWLHD